MTPKQILKFPEGFLWGAGTSAHQIEGNNTNSEWWAWENSVKRHNQLVAKGLNPKNFASDLACDSYNRYDEDFALAKELGHNSTRFSIEWARVEPKEGQYSEKELDHYEKVLQSAKYNGLTTFVTLHHFTNPLWFIQKGGFEKKDNIKHFIDYGVKATKRLSEYVDFWLTFNEPEIYSTHSYLAGTFPPNFHNPIKTFKVINHIIQTHNILAPKIKMYTGKPVSMAYHLSDIQPTSTYSSPLTSLIHYLVNEYILTRTINTCDFLGMNYYNHFHIGWLGRRKHSHSGHDSSDIGWGIHPEGLERLLLFLKKFNKPIYITENGIADANDTKREKFIKEHLLHVHSAIKKGVDVRGYLYWALIDNFEWAMGFAPRFGLIEVDYEDLRRRRVRYSAIKYAEICKTNELHY
jgi:beta-glucosidase